MKPIKFAVAMALTAMTVAGCSGGSHDTKDTILPDATELTLSGIVTDNPIVNASVIFRVGDSEYQSATPTGSAGEFSLAIGSDSPGAMVSGEAFQGATGVRLSAVFDTFEGCQLLARNGIVNDVKITNATTAQQVLAERLALDGKIDTYREFVDLSSQLDAEELLELSAALKVVIENLGGTALPTGVGDTVDLARAIADGSSSFMADMDLLSPGLLASARDLLLTDGNATFPFRSGDAPGVYASNSGDFIYAVFGDGSAFADFFDDNLVPGTPSWSIGDLGQLQINYYGFDRESDNLSVIGTADNVMHMVADYRAFDGTDAGRHAATVTRYRFGAGFDAATLAGTYTDSAAPGEEMVFAADGSGYFASDAMPAPGDSFAWIVTSDGRLNLDFGDGRAALELVDLGTGSNTVRQVLSISRYDGQLARLSVRELTRSD